MKWLNFLLHPITQAVIADSIIFSFLASRSGCFGEVKIKDIIIEHKEYKFYDLIRTDHNKTRIYIRPIK